MVEKKCVNCIYCGVERFSVRRRVQSEEVTETREGAVCRYNPPSGPRMKPVWPLVEADNDWCGRGKSADADPFV